jgi:hypothetical protein
MLAPVRDNLQAMGAVAAAALVPACRRLHLLPPQWAASVLLLVHVLLLGGRSLLSGGLWSCAECRKEEHNSLLEWGHGGGKCRPPQQVPLQSPLKSPVPCSLTFFVATPFFLVPAGWTVNYRKKERQIVTDGGQGRIARSGGGECSPPAPLRLTLSAAVAAAAALGLHDLAHSRIDLVLLAVLVLLSVKEG